MKYKSIYIANFTEVALELIKAMTAKQAEEEVFEDHALCDRFLLSEDDDRILVTPFPIDKDFFQDICKLFNFKNVLNFIPKRCSKSLCESISNDQTIIDFVKNNPGIKIHSYAGTDQFSKLINLWKSQGLDFFTPEIPENENRWTQDFFGSKAGFRQAAGILGTDFPKMPEGAICNSNDELRGWANYFADTGYVQKHNRGLAGAGLKIVQKDQVKTTRISENTWPVIIERFIEPDLTVCGGAPNIELRIINGKVEPLYTCAMRVTPDGVFKGIEIGKGAVNKKLDKLLNSSGKKWGKYLVKLGYCGYFEIDFVAGTDGKAYPLEANLRRTGGTHVYETAERLLGEKWKENYIVAKNIHETKFNNYADLKNATKHLFFKNGEGVIITVAKYLERNKLGYIVIGKNKKRALTLEKEFLALC